MTSRTTVIGAVAVAFFAASVGPVVAQDKRVRIQNETGYVMVEFYGSNAGTDDWEEDILGADILPPGGSVRVNFEDGTGYCMFDFKAVFEDGDVLTRSGVDVCKTGTFTYN
ncbi:hypothetical protein [Shimia sp. R9_3]|uniref:hypothetical protein n=1 Tax=Shimia sp. R9_3 TaxID=2821113 RepID=UPI001FFE2537|nr:hypothetical protein [Shimia sp. R9_3]